MIAGSVMVAVAVLGAVLGVAVIGSRIDFGGLDREVSHEGPSDRLVPGTIPFEVLEPLDGGSSDEMTVGVALSSSVDPAPDCTLVGPDGEEVPLVAPRTDDQLLDRRARHGDYQLVGTARLAPGEYEASCRGEGEPGDLGGVSFTVGRVLGFADVAGEIGPILGVVAVLGFSGLVFLVGVVLLIVGLVRSGRHRRGPSAAATWSPPGPPTGAGAPHDPGARGPSGHQEGWRPGPPSGPPQGHPPWSAPGPPPAPPPWSPPAAPPPSGPPLWGSPPPSGPGPDERTVRRPTEAGEADRDDGHDGGGGHDGWTVPPSKR